MQNAPVSYEVENCQKNISLLTNFLLKLLFFLFLLLILQLSLRLIPFDLNLLIFLLLLPTFVPSTLSPSINIYGTFLKLCFSYFISYFFISFRLVLLLCLVLPKISFTLFAYSIMFFCYRHYFYLYWANYNGNTPAKCSVSIPINLSNEPKVLCEPL